MYDILNDEGKVIAHASTRKKALAKAKRLARRGTRSPEVNYHFRGKFNRRVY